MNLILIIFFLLTSLAYKPCYAQLRIDTSADFHLGLVRPGILPTKESILYITSTSNYTIRFSGRHDNNLTFNLANGVDKVPYALYFKDNSNGFIQLLPNTPSAIFQSIDNGSKRQATLKMHILSMAPRPGHYSDTLTLIITPA